MKRSRLLYVFSAVVASVALSVAATAWACTEFTGLVAPKSATATAQVQVKGSGQVTPSDAAKQVEIRWNDVPGPVVARANAAEIAAGVQVTIPDAPAGIYFLLAVIDDKSIARTSIEVTSPSGATAAPVDFRPLSPPTRAPLPRSDSQSALLTGVTLLAGGLVVMFGGALALITMQSRKARVGVTPGDDHLKA